MEKGVKRRSLGLELSLSLDIPQHSLIRLELATLSAALDPPPRPIISTQEVIKALSYYIY